MMHIQWTISDECQDSLSDSRFRLLAVSNSSLRFSDFPLTTMELEKRLFFSMWSQAEVKIWWIAFITSSGGTAAGIFCMKKSQNHLNEEEILAWKKSQLIFGAKIQTILFSNSNFFLLILAWTQCLKITQNIAF